MDMNEPSGTGAGMGTSLGLADAPGATLIGGIGEAFIGGIGGTFIGGMGVALLPLGAGGNGGIGPCGCW